MTGEMSQDDVTREAFPIHFALADALGGEVRPFDVYQGPYVLVPRGRTGKGAKLWVVYDDSGSARLYNESTDRQSARFPIHDDSAPLFAANYAHDRRHWHKVKRESAA